MTQVQIEMPVEEFLTAGLTPEGIYRLRVKSLEVLEKTVQQGDRQGQQYKVIEGQFNLVELYGEGILDNPPLEFLKFYVPKGLERFRKLYVAAFGAVAEGSPGQTVTLNDLAAALVGNDMVWTTFSWRRDKKNPDDILGNIGFSFSSDPDTLREPRPFAERDAA